MLFMRAFAYLFDARPSGLNPLAILRAAPAFVLARRRINEAVAGDYMVRVDLRLLFASQTGNIAGTGVFENRRLRWDTACTQRRP